MGDVINLEAYRRQRKTGVKPNDPAVSTEQDPVPTKPKKKRGQRGKETDKKQGD